MWSIYPHMANIEELFYTNKHLLKMILYSMERNACNISGKRPNQAGSKQSTCSEEAGWRHVARERSRHAFSVPPVTVAREQQNKPLLGKHETSMLH